MDRSLVIIRKWIVVLALLTSFVGERSNAQPDPSITPADTPTVETEQADVQRFRHIIATPTNDLTSRRLMASELLGKDLASRLDLVIELLSQPHDTGTPAVMAYAIADVGAHDPSQLDDGMIEPLLDLLASDNVDLRKQVTGALAVFPAADVAPRLSSLANDSDRPIVQRHEAVDALSIKVTKREVVGELIKLLRSNTPSVVDRASHALKDASRENFGSNVDSWESWWERKLNLSEAEWLRDRLDMVERRSRQLRDRIRRLKEDRIREDRAWLQLSDDLLTRVYQLTQDSKREELLIEWLAHGVGDVRIHALDLIHKQITEGNIPSEAVRLGVTQCLSGFTSEVRITALAVVGTMKNPEDATLVMSLLRGESDDRIRATILRTLGRLENPSAIDILIAELKDPNADRECVLEAAWSIGVVGGRGRVDAETIAPAIQPLRERFAAAPVDDIPFRETLLLAMANLGTSETVAEFVSHLNSESTELVLAAIRGIITSQSASHIDRVADRLAHPDPRVRQLAVDAVGALGDKPEHLRALVSRLNPDEESSEAVRSAAFQGFRRALDRQPSVQRLEWIEKLAGQADLQVAILNDYITEWNTNGAGQELVDRARSMLKSILLEANRKSEAATVLRAMYDASVTNGGGGTFDVGVELLQTHLDLKQYRQAGELLVSLASQADVSQKEQLLTLLRAGAALVSTEEDRSAFLKEFSSISPDLSNPDWLSTIFSASEKTNDSP